MQVKPHKASQLITITSLISKILNHLFTGKQYPFLKTLSNNHLKFLYKTAIYSLSVTAKPSATVIAARATESVAAHVATTEAT